MCRYRCAGFVTAAIFALCPGAAFAQLRIANWNVTNYSGGRVSAFQTAIYGVFEGRSMVPDILIGQEFLSAAGVTAFLNLLNAAPGSPGNWAAAPFIDGPDTDSAFFYRTSKVTFLSVTVVAVGGLEPNHPRNIQRYDIRPVGYAAAGATLACYSSHMKSGTSSSDQARRLVEAQRIRDDAQVLPADWHFLLGGDFNIQSSSQAAYVELVGAQADDAGRFFDPILTPGNWNNNGAFHFVHTQDPAGAGGMDDRHDQILLSASLIDGEGFDYVGDPAMPYSTTTWNDANHSYRAWGNDGSSFDGTLTVAGNQMVGSTIAQALVDSAAGQGHLPVFLDMRVPPRITSDLTLDFGQAEQGAAAERLLAVANDGEVVLWGTNGVADLEYSLEPMAGFTAPAGWFIEPPGGSSADHVIMMDTSTVGPMSGTLTIFSNAPDEPARIVSLVGEVVGSTVPGDLDGDGDVDLDDYARFAGCLNGPEVSAPPPGCNPADFETADLNGDGDVDLEDCAFLVVVFAD
jgi:hypothetical protein